MSGRAVVLRERPLPGRTVAECLEVVDCAVPDCPPGGVVIATELLSCDPYQRLRMVDTYDLGAAVPARAVGRVVASRDSRLQVGDRVWGVLSWATHVAADPASLHPVDPADGPASHAITVRGMPGLTAYVGMVELGRPAAGQTVVVSGAARAVGSIAGQLAALAGACVVGIVGSATKARLLVDDLGFHAAVRHDGPVPLDEALAAATPGGIDVAFENVGGRVLDASLRRLASGARVVLCGMVAGYDGTGRDARVEQLMRLCGAGATMHGLNAPAHAHRLDEIGARLGGLVRDGRLRFHEDVVDGIDRLPAAYAEMLAGGSVGKRLVRVAG